MKLLRRSAVALLLVTLLFGLMSRDHIRTLNSLERIPGTNAYVMDYYADYNLDEIREHGIDVDDLEGSFIENAFPAFLVPVVNQVKRAYLPEKIEILSEPSSTQQCSTVTLRSANGDAFFGRNFDWHHDAYLILRVHRHGKVESIAVVDLAYLNMDRPDLDKLSLLGRVPLLLAPYYLMDGMNCHGVAVADMSVPDAKAPRDDSKADVIHSTMMRMILDEAKSADEAVDLIRQYNIHFVDARVHLMIADAKGESRVVEFIDGELRVTRNEENWQVCTNHIKWQKSEAENDAACSRYLKGSDAAASLPENIDFNDAKRVIREMSVENWTMWTSIYDLSNRRVQVLYKSQLDDSFTDDLNE